MTAPTHLVIGIASSVALARLTGFALTPVVLLAVFLGSIAPDIDGDGVVSRPGRLFSRFLSRRVASILDAFGQALSAFFRATLGHRGFFHWPVVALILCLSSVFLQSVFLFWFGWGYLFHILADACTPAGVPLFAPITVRDIHFFSIPTGSFREFILFGIVCVCVIVFGWDLLPVGVRDSFRDFHL